MGNIVKLSLFRELDKNRAEHWDDLYIVRVFINNLLEYLITLLKVLLAKILLCFNLPHVV